MTQEELLAIVRTVKHFRTCLYGKKFRLWTDHASILRLCRKQEPISHRAGKQHNKADRLSRPGQCLNGSPTRQELNAKPTSIVGSIVITSNQGTKEIAEALQHGETLVKQIRQMVLDRGVASRDELNAAGK